jgi:hypothetical protein
MCAQNRAFSDPEMALFSQRWGRSQEKCTVIGVRLQSIIRPATGERYTAGMQFNLLRTPTSMTQIPRSDGPRSEERADARMALCGDHEIQKTLLRMDSATAITHIRASP